MKITETTVKSILTRTTGFLKTVSSHSLQPYRGCAYGNALCGVGCYVRHNSFLTRGARWGSFLEAKLNAAELYEKQYPRELNWARERRGKFVIFMSSSTDPFVPQETRFGLTREILGKMRASPPDELIIQTHTHKVISYLDLYLELQPVTDLRFHISIESDRDRLPGLPPPVCSVAQRFEAASALRRAGLRVVVTVAPLLPIENPQEFFSKIADAADAVVLDHFIQGDGSLGGGRTAKTELPTAMANVDPQSISLDYRDRMVSVAQKIMPGRVGVNIDGFAGRFL